MYKGYFVVNKLKLCWHAFLAFRLSQGSAAT